MRTFVASAHLVPVTANPGIVLWLGNAPGAVGVYTPAEGFSGALATQQAEAMAQAGTSDPVEADRFFFRKAVAARLADPLGTIALGAGANPYELEIDPADSTRGWLTTFLSGELIELDLARRTILRRITVGPPLQSLWVGPSEIAVTLTGFNATTFGYDTGYAIRFDKATLAETARLAVPTNPQISLNSIKKINISVFTR